MWLPQIEVLFDIPAMNADASSYLSCSVKNVLTIADEKKHKYLIATETCRGSFSPFMVTVDGALDSIISVVPC